MYAPNATDRLYGVIEPHDQCAEFGGELCVHVVQVEVNAGFEKQLHRYGWHALRRLDAPPLIDPYVGIVTGATRFTRPTTGLAGARSVVWL